MLVALAALLPAGSCSRPSTPAVQRLAILRFENLTPDPATDWIGRALSEVITAELSGSARIYAIPSSRLHSLNALMGPRPVGAPGISAEMQLAIAVGANRIGYGEFEVSGGRLRARLNIEDPQNRRMSQGPIVVSAAAAEPIVAATTIAKQIAPDATSYETSNTAALEAYVRGMEAGDTAGSLQFAEQAAAADPNYGAAHVLATEAKLKQQDRAGAAQMVGSVAARASGMSPTTRLRLEILTANLRGDGAAAERSMEALVRAAPLDPLAWRSLAEAQAGGRKYKEAEASYQRALQIEPEDASTWNQLGYVAAYGGSLEEGVAALQRYQALRPAEANPLDSMGDIHLMYGRLKEAEQFYLEAHRKNPAFLGGVDRYKAAMARLMTGDTTGADKVLEGKGGPEWLWLKGLRKEAYDRLATDVETLPKGDPQARAYSALAVWALLLGDRESGARMAMLAAPLATPATGGTAALARFVTLPSAPAAEWAARAEKVFPSANANAIRTQALAYGLLLDRHFEAAIAPLRSFEARAGTGGDRSAAIGLAWALIETGRQAEAEPLLRWNSVPGPDAGFPFIGLYFPRVFQLRSIVAERAGRADEARESRKVYTALGGQ
jgi:tetratricopeptide (TPR) repeat protein